jgi:hypothetical protein
MHDDMHMNKHPFDVLVAAQKLNDAGDTDAAAALIADLEYRIGWALLSEVKPANAKVTRT